MPRFSIKDLLIATTLVAIGTGMLVFVVRNSRSGFSVPMFALWFVGGVLIGAGTLAPFKSPWLGALVAFVLQVMFMAVALLV